MVLSGGGNQNTQRKPSTLNGQRTNSSCLMLQAALLQRHQAPDLHLVGGDLLYGLKPSNKYINTKFHLRKTFCNAVTTLLSCIFIALGQTKVIRFSDTFFKIEMCPQYTDTPAVGYLTIKLQNSTWYKCLNLSLTGSCTYIYSYRRMYIRTHVHVRTYRKPKSYMPPASSDAGA